MKGLLIKRRLILFFIMFFLLEIPLLRAKTIIATSADYSALAEAPMEKIISDNFGNLYTIYRVESSGAYQQWIYSSFDNGRTWIPVGNGPIHTFNYDQRRGSIAIGKDGKIYAVWTGADDENTGQYLDPSDNKYKYGEYQLKFAYFWHGKWSEWKNIAVVPGYEEWVASAQPGEERKYWQENPSIAIDSKNNLYVVWEGEDSQFEGSQIKFTKSVDGGNTWSQWINLTRVASTPGTNYNQYRPLILIDNNDRIFVIWDGEDKNHVYNNGKPYSAIKYCYSDDYGKTWSPTSPFGGYGGYITTKNKTQRYVSGCVDPKTGIIHIVWTGRDPGYDDEPKAQVRYGYYDGTWHEVGGYVSKTPGWEQKHPNITVDSNGTLYVMWQGNDDNHPYYDEGDPDTDDDKTGFYIMYSYKTNGGNFSLYKILDKGLYPHLLKSEFGSRLAWVYTRPDGWDEFNLVFDSDTNIVLPRLYNKPEITISKDNVYFCPNPFNPTLYNSIVQYELNNRAKVEITIYDITGNKIATLLNGIRDKGRHRFYWAGGIGDFSATDNEVVGESGDKIKSGVYILYMKIGENVTKKKLFVKR